MKEEVPGFKFKVQRVGGGSWEAGKL